MRDPSVAYLTFLLTQNDDFASAVSDRQSVSAFGHGRDHRCVGDGGLLDLPMGGRGFSDGEGEQESEVGRGGVLQGDLIQGRTARNSSAMAP